MVRFRAPSRVSVLETVTGWPGFGLTRRFWRTLETRYCAPPNPQAGTHVRGGAEASPSRRGGPWPQPCPGPVVVVAGKALHLLPACRKPEPEVSQAPPGIREQRVQRYLSQNY